MIFNDHLPKHYISSSVNITWYRGNTVTKNEYRFSFSSKCILQLVRVTEDLE